MDFVPEVSAVSTENIEVRVLGGGGRTCGRELCNKLCDWGVS